MSQDYPSIASYLPIAFTNGSRVNRFGKECPQCHKLVMADAMFGRMLLVQDRILLAAEGQCPHCGHHFPISCVITDDKKVHRIFMPMIFLRWWLSTMHGDEQGVRTQSEDWEYHPATTLPEHQPKKAAPQLQGLTRSQEILGSFDGVKIPAKVFYDNGIYEFLRVAPRNGFYQLAASEILVDEVLIYGLASSEK